MREGCPCPELKEYFGQSGQNYNLQLGNRPIPQISCFFPASFSCDLPNGQFASIFSCVCGFLTMNFEFSSLQEVITNQRCSSAINCNDFIAEIILHFIAILVNLSRKKFVKFCLSISIPFAQGNFW